MTSPHTNEALRCRIREIGKREAGKFAIVTRGRLVSGAISPTPFFVKEDEVMGTLAFNPESNQFYLVESGEGIARMHDIEYDNGRLFIDGWPTTSENWRWIRWIIEF
jgi:hypothetical protein